MKIVEDGDFEQFIARVRCERTKPKHGYMEDIEKRRCNSLLEINQDDIEASPWEANYGKDWGVNYSVTCPKCGCTIYLNSRILPRWVKEEAINRNPDLKKLGAYVSNNPI